LLEIVARAATATAVEEDTPVEEDVADTAVDVVATRVVDMVVVKVAKVAREALSASLAAGMSINLRAYWMFNNAN
jgi:hypothetical protein